MESENFSVEIDGQELSDLYANLISLEVELDEELAGMFRLHIAMLLQPDGSWTYLDDERLKVWKEVAINAGFESAVDNLFRGYITHVKPHFDPDPAQATLEIWGMDKSVLMDREEKLKGWPNKKDSDIAAEIFTLYEFEAQVEDTTVVHDEAISTIIQRETDMQFLKRLALRNGLECYVEGETGYFQLPNIDSPPQPVLTAHFGNETNLISFDVEVNALVPANVAMFQVDRLNKELLDETAETTEQTVLGETDAAGLLATKVDPALVYIGRSAATGNPEMAAMCQGLYHRGEWFVTAEGEVAANQYGHVLKPRGTVTIKGVGETYSGVYYVTHVTHSFTSEGYTQSFKVKRNALLPSGSEDFSGTSDGLF